MGFTKTAIAWCLLLSVHIVVEAVCPDENITAKTVVRIGMMTAADNLRRFVSVGCIPAINLALDLINANDSILYGYYLTYNETIYDTRCDRSSAYDRFFDLVESPMDPTIAIIGAGCSTASEPVAEISPYWSVPMIAYVSASPLLSNRLRYPSFFRTYPSDALIAPAFVTLTKSFGWTRLCIISENEPVFVENIREQLDLLAEANILVTPGSFQFETGEDIASIEERLDRAVEDDVHVFFVNTFEDSARIVFCYFYRKGLRYPAYGFMTHAWYQETWYNRNSSINCTQEQIREQLHRVITFLPFIFNEDRKEPTISGLSADEFDDMYRDRLNGTGLIYQSEAYTAFDAVYSLALALDSVQKGFCNGDNLGCDNTSSLQPIEDFQYYNAQFECMVNKSLSNTNFTGVSGVVRFDENGTRIINNFQIRQYRLIENSTTLNHSIIASVDGNIDNFRFIEGNNDKLVWPEGVPPDGTPIININTLSIGLIVVMDVFAGAGIVFTIVCLIFNIVFREKRIIKLTSPNLNYVILAGAFTSYVSVFLRMLPGTDSHSLAARCDGAYFLSVFGYVLAFSAVLAKMWRVFYIFHNPTTKKRSLKDWHLLLVVAILTGIVLLLLIIGTAVPDLRQTAMLVDDKEHSDSENELNVTVTNMIYACSTSAASVIYEGVVFGYLFILQLVAVIFAFQTRKVKIKALNDAKQVIAIIYTTTVCLVVLILTSFALGQYLNTTNALYALSIMAATTIFLTLIFIPKMISLYQDPKGENVFSTRSGGTANSSGLNRRKTSRSLSLQMGNAAEDSKALIQKLEIRVSQLREELDRYELQAPSNDDNFKKVSTVSFEEGENSPIDLTLPRENGRKTINVSFKESVESIDDDLAPEDDQETASDENSPKTASDKNNPKAVNVSFKETDEHIGDPLPVEENDQMAASDET